jgi:hypothetical protein
MTEDKEIVDPDSEDSSRWLNSELVEKDQGCWETPIVRDTNEEVIGASFFVTADDLDALGIEVDSVSKIGYSITATGRIIVFNPED